MTQCPRGTIAQPEDVLDIRYPTGTRVVIAKGAVEGNRIRLLSRGLAAAGGPVASPDGKRILFAGKLQPKDEWQIYEASWDGVKLKRLTSISGGCLDPALLPGGNVVFVSPVQKVAGSASLGCTPSLYVQSPGAPPHQVTFGNIGASNPTVLRDGRILFVGTTPGSTPNAPAKVALYTINSDGTEISAFAGQHEKLNAVQRPRELDDGRIVFLTTGSCDGQPETAEFVLSAAPFRGRQTLFGSPAQVRSVEPGLNGKLMVCAGVNKEPGDFCQRWVLFSVEPGSAKWGSPILEHLEWDQIEAIPAVSVRRPMGRLSTVDMGRRTGQILCLNANETSYGVAEHSHENRAARIRVYTESSRDKRLNLGEVDLQADGSFMAEVPANIPLGFEALDELGNVIRREPALIWVRPGENRSCIGCHEPHNHAPRNLRPLAVRMPVPRLLGAETATLARNQQLQ